MSAAARQTRSRISVLKALRVAHSLTQRELADAAGLDEITIVRLERDPSRATVATLLALAQALDVPVAALLPR